MYDVAQKGVVSVVDDDDSLRQATTKLIRLHGYLVHEFASAEEILQSPALDATACLVSDVRMAGMSGLELQALLNARGYKIPVIFVTAFPEDRTRKRALAAGAFAFLAKPFDGDALLRIIEQALGGSG